MRWAAEGGVGRVRLESCCCCLGMWALHLQEMSVPFHGMRCAHDQPAGRELTGMHALSSSCVSYRLQQVASKLSEVDEELGKHLSASERSAQVAVGGTHTPPHHHLHHVPGMARPSSTTALATIAGANGAGGQPPGSEHGGGVGATGVAAGGPVAAGGSTIGTGQPPALPLLRLQPSQRWNPAMFGSSQRLTLLPPTGNLAPSGPSTPGRSRGQTQKSAAFPSTQEPSAGAKLLHSLTMPARRQGSGLPAADEGPEISTGAERDRLSAAAVHLRQEAAAAGGSGGGSVISAFATAQNSALAGLGLDYGGFGHPSGHLPTIPSLESSPVQGGAGQPPEPAPHTQQPHLLQPELLPLPQLQPQGQGGLPTFAQAGPGPASTPASSQQPQPQQPPQHVLHYPSGTEVPIGGDLRVRVVQARGLTVGADRGMHMYAKVRPGLLWRGCALQCCFSRIGLPNCHMHAILLRVWNKITHGLLPLVDRDLSHAPHPAPPYCSATGAHQGPGGGHAPCARERSPHVEV